MQKKQEKNKNRQDQKTKNYQNSRTLSHGGDSYVKTPNQNHNINKVTQISCRLSAVRKIRERRPNNRFPTNVSHLQIAHWFLTSRICFKIACSSPPSQLYSLSPHCNSESVAGQAGQKWPALHMSRAEK